MTELFGKTYLKYFSAEKPEPGDALQREQGDVSQGPVHHPAEDVHGAAVPDVLGRNVEQENERLVKIC